MRRSTFYILGWGYRFRKKKSGVPQSGTNHTAGETWENPRTRSTPWTSWPTPWRLGKPFSFKNHGMEWGITWYHIFNIFRHPHENANAFHTVKVCPFSCIVGSNAKTLRNQEWLDELVPREWGIMSSRHVFLANPGKPRGFRFVSHSKGRIRKVHD